MIGVGSRQHRMGGDACLVWNYLAGIDMNVMRAHTEGSFGCLVGAASPSSDRYECHECARGGQLRWFDVQQQNNVCGDGSVQKKQFGHRDRRSHSGRAGTEQGRERRLVDARFTSSDQ